MFTVIAIAVGIAFVIWASRSNDKERLGVSEFEDKLVKQSIVFGREDLKLIALLLFAILVMLGVIADYLS